MLRNSFEIGALAWVRALLSLAFVNLAACASTDSSDSSDAHVNHIVRTRQPIVGGLEVHRGAFSAVGWLNVGCSATLVHPDVVVFAAHCGLPSEGVWVGDRFDLDVDPISRIASVRPSGFEQLLHVRDCEVHPEAAIGNGHDLAFCLLERPASGVEPLPISLGCEREQAVEGHTVTLVGFGFDSELEEGPTLGIKRAVVAPIVGLGFELRLGDESAGTCAGDSGGPALIRVPSAAPHVPGEWRLLGVLSSGARGECGEGRYTDVSRFMPWLEARTQRDLSPCFDAEQNWDPSEECVEVHLDENGLPGGDARPSMTCGPSLRTDDAPDGVKQDPSETLSCAASSSSRFSGWPLMGLMITLSARRAARGATCARRRHRLHREGNHLFRR